MAEQGKLAPIIASAKLWTNQAVMDVAAVRDGGGGPTARFTVWFGDPEDDNRTSLVFARYYGIWNLLNAPNFTSHLWKGQTDDVTKLSYCGEPPKLFFNGSDAYAKTSGWETPGYMVYLCPRFWRIAPRFAPSSASGTLIHELAHAISKNVDDINPHGEKRRPEQDEFTPVRAWAVVQPNGGPIINGAAGGSKVNDGDSYKFFAERQN